MHRSLNQNICARLAREITLCGVVEPEQVVSEPGTRSWARVRGGNGGDRIVSRQVRWSSGVRRGCSASESCGGRTRGVPKLPAQMDLQTSLFRFVTVFDTAHAADRGCQHQPCTDAEGNSNHGHRLWQKNRGLFQGLCRELQTRQGRARGECVPSCYTQLAQDATTTESCRFC